MKLIYLHTNPISSTQANITQVLYMCDAFAKLGIEVELVLPIDEKRLSNEQLDILTMRKINKQRNFSIRQYKRIKVSSRFNAIGDYFGLRRHVIESNPDIFFTRTPIVLPVIRKLNKPVIFESHSPHLQNSFKLLDKIYKLKLSKEMRKNKKLALVTISEALRKYWIDKGMDASKIFSLHDGFDDSIFNTKDSKLIIRNRLNIDDETTVVTYIGSLYKDRGIERILKLAELFPRCNFFVAGGSDKEVKHYQSESDFLNLKNIKFLGWLDRPEIIDYLLISDILIMIWSKRVPTIDYCSPMKLFEYMSSGNLIVGDGYPTIKEVLTDGVNSLLAEPDSFQSLSNKMKEAIDLLPDKSVGLNAKKLAMEKYSWSSRADGLKNIMIKLESM